MFAIYQSDKGLILCIKKECKKNLNTFTRKNNPIKKWAKDMNRHLSKGDIYAANTHLKKSSSSLSLEKCISKPHGDTISHQLEWRSFKKSGNKMLERMWRNRNAFTLLVGV